MNEVPHPTIAQAARLITARGGAAALTGAGISVPSGIPDFRSPSGLWQRLDPLEYATIDAFERDPVKVWRLFRELDEIVRRACPNPAHTALAELERRNWLDGVATQNVDGLHQRAGSKRVIELHGSAETLTCPACGRRYTRAQAEALGGPPRCLACGSVLKPDVVLFGEALPMDAFDQALALMQNAPALLVVGTSAEVHPVADLPREAKRNGALIIEINPQPSALTADVTDLHIAEPAERALPALVEAIVHTR